METSRLSAPIVAAAAMVDGTGYWLLGADGRVYSFKDATTYRRLGRHHTVVAMAVTLGGGYWAIGLKWGRLSLRRRQALRLGEQAEAPVVGIIVTPDALGFWLIEANRELLHFGDARALPSPDVAVSGGVPANF